MTTVLSTLDELEEALVTGIRGVEIAQRVGDLSLRVITKTCLEEAYYYRGEYAHAVDFAMENLAVLPTEWAHEYFGLAVPPSVFGRAWLIMSLAELGRFAEAAKYEAEAIRIADPTQHAHTIGWANMAASMLHLFKGDWVKTRLLVEQWINIPRTLDVAVLLPWAVATAAWALAQIGEANDSLSRVREAEQLLERQTESGIVGHRGWAYQAVSRACLLMGRLDDARRLAHCSIDSAQRQPGFTAHALRLLGDLASHPEQFDAESGAAHYRQALALADMHGMRPLAAHCRLGLGKLYGHIGRPDHARENLTAATAMYREMGMNFWLEQDLSLTN
jgi:tetratricopeptide (TPR) repeat protein